LLLAWQEVDCWSTKVAIQPARHASSLDTDRMPLRPPLIQIHQFRLGGDDTFLGSIHFHFLGR
jgi:hypothetical protein